MSDRGRNEFHDGQKVIVNGVDSEGHIHHDVIGHISGGPTGPFYMDYYVVAASGRTFRGYTFRIGHEFIRLYTPAPLDDPVALEAWLEA